MGKGKERNEGSTSVAWKSSEVDNLLSKDEFPAKKKYVYTDLWYLDGKAYDFTDFIKRHPGGPDAITLGKGLDCTELFQSYHFWRIPPAELLNKYLVTDAPELPDKPAVKFTFEPDGFYNVCKDRVRTYFKENQLQPHARPVWQVIMMFHLFAVIGLMYPTFVHGSFLAALALGFLKGVLAVGAGHGMSHFSIFYGPYNYWMFRSFSFLILSNAELWGTSHVISHHVHTLLENDLQDNHPLKRVQKVHKWYPYHRFQHLYIWLVYAFGLCLWTIDDFFMTIPTLFTGKHEMRRFTLQTRVENFLCMFANLFFTVTAPFFFLPFWHALAILVVYSVSSSAIVVLQIVVNHEVDLTDHGYNVSVKDEDSKKSVRDWGSHQCLTSHNFAPNSEVALHLSGGLNMQLEHHLFPGVHYVHYKNISPIVKKTCEEFGLPYITTPSLFHALQAHYRLLKYYADPNH